MGPLNLVWKHVNTHVCITLKRSDWLGFPWVRLWGLKSIKVTILLILVLFLKTLFLTLHLPVHQILSIRFYEIPFAPNC